MTWTAFPILAMFLVISNKVQTRFTKHGVTWLWSHSEIDIPLVSSRKSKPHCQSQEDIWRKSVNNKSIKKSEKTEPGSFWSEVSSCETALWISTVDTTGTEDRRSPRCLWEMVKSRDIKNQTFPVGRVSRAKTFQIEWVNRFRNKKCVNSFCDINVDKLHLLTCHVYHGTHVDTIQNFSRLSWNCSLCWKFSRLRVNFPDSRETF